MTGDLNIKFRAGAFAVEHRGRLDYRVHHGDHEIARRFESLSGAFGYAEYLHTQEKDGDTWGILRDLTYVGATPEPTPGEQIEMFAEASHG